jgi:hypothetical protein
MSSTLANILALIQLNALTLFGLLAVGLMLLFYTLENRAPIFVLAFALACMMGATYGFLQGAWPFGIVESVWSFVALRRWWMMPTPAQIAAQIASAQPDRGHVARFLQDLQTLAPAAGRGTYAFNKPGGEYHGYVQFIIDSPAQVTIHRIWSDEPGQGSGNFMMRTLCELADRHGVAMKLKVLPIGRKPYPMNRDELFDWYQRFGFEGQHKKMIRIPRRQQSIRAAEVVQN